MCSEAGIPGGTDTRSSVIVKWSREPAPDSDLQNARISIRGELYLPHGRETYENAVERKYTRYSWRQFHSHSQKWILDPPGKSRG
jgi:hypothetical protein